MLVSLALVLVTMQPLVPLTSAALTVTSTFNQSGVMGTIRFTQANPTAPTVMDISLTGTCNSVPLCFVAGSVHFHIVLHLCTTNYYPACMCLWFADHTHSAGMWQCDCIRMLEVSVRRGRQVTITALSAEVLHATLHWLQSARGMCSREL